MLNYGKYLKHLDMLFASVLLIGSFILLLFCLHFNLISGRVLTMLCSLFLAPLLYIIGKRKSLTQQKKIQAKHKIFLNYLFISLFCISIYLLYINTYVRPVTYFILFTILSVIILIEIQQTDDIHKESIILCKIILIATSLRFGILYAYPSLLGIDPPYHMNQVRLIIDTGFIPKSGGIYFDNPLSYLSTIINMFVLGLDYKNSLIIAVGIPMIISILFVYLLGRVLFSNKIGLIASLFIGAYPFHILYSYVLIPNCTGFVFYSILLYFIFCNKLPFKILTIILLFSLLFAHPLVPPILIFTLITFSMGSWLYGLYIKKMMPVFSFNLIIIAILTRWIYGIVGAPIFGSVIENVKNVLTTFEDANIIISSPFVSTSNDLLSESLNTAGIALLTMLAILGVLYAINEWKNNYTIGFVTVFLSMFFLTTGSSMMGIAFLLPQRWLVFLGIYLSIFSAFGATKLFFKNNLLILTMFIMIFLMITNSFANMDSPIYSKKETVRYAYTESEIHAADSINRIYDGCIITDMSYVGYFRSIPRDIDFIEIPFKVPDNKILVVREYMLNNPIYVASEYAANIVILSAQDKLIINQISLKNDRIYANGQVNAYKS